MDKENVLHVLYELNDLETGSTQAYELAAEQAGDAEVSKMFRQFRDEHQLMIGNLSVIIEELGGEAPALQGESGVGAIELGNARGKVETLEAMRANELSCLKAYERMGPLLQDLPIEARTLLRDNYEMDETHLNAIEQALSVGQA